MATPPVPPVPPTPPSPPPQQPPLPPQSFITPPTPPPVIHVTPARRSVVGPLILILIGLAFLLHHFVPYIAIGHLFVSYWPLLLIIWGLVKLVENVSARRGGDGRHPFMTGGEIGLLVIFLLFVALISVFDKIHQRFPDMDFGDVWADRGSPVTDELPARQIAAKAPVTIDTPRGDVTIFADEDNQIRVVVTKTVRSTNEDESRRRARQVTISFDPDNGGYHISPVSPHTSRTRVDFEVHLPKTVNLTIQTGHGDIVASGIEGQINATSEEGSIEIHDAKGNITGTLKKGDVRMTNIQGDVHLLGRGNDIELSGIQGNAAIDGDFLGSIEVDNVSDTTRYNSSRTDLTLLHLQGRLEMDSGSLQISDVLGNIKLNTRNRDVELDNVVGRLDLVDAHGDISVSLKKTPKDEINIANDSGAVDVSIPSSSTFEISASSRNGEINSDFEGGNLSSQNDENSSVLVGKVGSRGPKITITTSYGTISLHKSDS